ncbi:hypothetical protein [Stenotrophomonas maltophilia]|uniref:hypothetical protein n=1 Tax=Stenotrophomonas maltophilia TaxID=40324 RepID=UPI0021C08114|nr:hypothetical protein [Stenotrophomonas maltophilia]UXL29516.1 hypothetical protein N0O74_01495 [Stenotrophomonas maltophilia]
MVKSDLLHDMQYFASEFMESDVTKLITLALVVLLLIAMHASNLLINRGVSEEVRAAHRKAATDGVVKTAIMLFAGCVAYAVALTVTDSNRATSGTVFGFCVTSGVASCWTAYKTRESIREARNLGEHGQRRDGIADVESVNRISGKFALASIAVGILGLLINMVFADRLGWLWFLAFACTALPIKAARFSDSAALAIAPYAKGADHRAKSRKR